MPGVPSGRGCDACRKQKKKCNIEKVPCPRCERLDIPCTGLGKQRYKFIVENEKVTAVNALASSCAYKQPIVTQPSRSLSNPLIRLTGAFIERIDPFIDIRFQLLWNFGDYLADIPCRLGRSRALDAAADAVVMAHTRFCVGLLDPDITLLAKHSRALSVLRQDLNDPIKAHSSETLCSIMLLMIYETLTKPTPSLTSHPGGAARVLKSRGYSGPLNDFESKLLSALRGPVIVEALTKDEIIFTQQEWNELVMPGYEGANGDGNVIQCLARVPSLLQRCKDSLPRTCFSEPTLTKLKSEVLSLRQNSEKIIMESRDRLYNVNMDSTPLTIREHIQAHYLCIYGMGLGTGIILNCMLAMLDDDYLRLQEESSRYSNEIFQLAESAVKYQPLGSVAIILCLSVAWLGAPDPAFKERIKTLLSKYVLACLGRPASNLNADLERLKKRFALQ